jgi:hypothetical protein
MKRVLAQKKELTGKPGNVWNGVVVPGGGKTAFAIEDDLLIAKTVTTFGLERKTIYTKLSDIGSIELCQGRLWWLIVLGISTLAFFFVGLIFIILFFFLKQKWITVHCRSVTLTLFYKKQPDAEAFKDTLLAEITRGKNPDKIQSKKSPGLPQSKANLSKSDDPE